MPGIIGIRANERENLDSPVARNLLIPDSNDFKALLEP